MRKIMILLAALMMAIGLGASASAAPSPAAVAPYSTAYAPLAVTQGFHNHTFHSCTVDGRQAKTYIRYEITSVGSSTGWFQLQEIVYETTHSGHPAFEGNAARLDLETWANSYGEVSPAWGGSSATLDDMPSWYAKIYINTQPLFSFDLGDTPALRFRFYGVGAGSVGGRCDDYAAVE